jgi:hypothetical protein
MKDDRRYADGPADCVYGNPGTVSYLALSQLKGGS